MKVYHSLAEAAADMLNNTFDHYELIRCKECTLIRRCIAGTCDECRENMIKALAGNLVFGWEEGDICNRNGCLGILHLTIIEGCCCHISPPCHACTNQGIYCPSCYWDSRED